MTSTSYRSAMHTNQNETPIRRLQFSTFLISLISLPMFYFEHELVFFGIAIVLMILAGFFIYAGRQNRTLLTNIGYLLPISILNLLAILRLGVTMGFAYAFFALVALIICDTELGKLKIVAVFVEIIAVIAVLHFAKTPTSFLNLAVAPAINAMNLAFGIYGVAYPVHFLNRQTELAHNEVTKLLIREEQLTRKIGGDAIMMIDVDRFETIYDAFGPVCMSSLLDQVENLIRQSGRKSDNVFRYGREEFIFELSVNRYQNLIDITERLRKSIENREFVCGNQKINITVSIGAAYKPADSHISHKTTLEIAEGLLEQAKSEGRNRVVLKQLTY